MAATHDISIDQGASFSMYLTIKDEANEKIDLSGHVFRGKIKKDLFKKYVKPSAYRSGLLVQRYKEEYIKSI